MVCVPEGCHEQAREEQRGEEAKVSVRSADQGVPSILCNERRDHEPEAEKRSADPNHSGQRHGGAADEPEPHDGESECGQQGEAQWPEPVEAPWVDRKEADEDHGGETHLRNVPVRL